jgi:hypothetical protein
MTKLGTVQKSLGYDSIRDMLEEAAGDSVVPGICSNLGCTYVVEEVEPDCADGHCVVCNTNTVESILVLEGVI